MASSTHIAVTLLLLLASVPMANGARDLLMKEGEVDPRLGIVRYMKEGALHQLHEPTEGTGVTQHINAEDPAKGIADSQRVQKMQAVTKHWKAPYEGPTELEASEIKVKLLTKGHLVVLDEESEVAHEMAKQQALAAQAAANKRATVMRFSSTEELKNYFNSLDLPGAN
mmetsp:Transcript_34365/g.97344  ORF Transcript_34365/g.97344 Transcript_34365/m.97344 type:complete len:169 (-) Transcript_34365:87-593(-)|eukprot:CAMPEP_0117664028 /NCGR_PEP_ID=MMETSP0804-20121206/8967_1 /TAXON_ID=1074897 /ORGANISM="Tetraselmis astigmatica, Strain CCMP880" /LENGTH=168 /DNA_ID=CAMNT_0005471165 /DNA_START=104 /DNA_END=610 /DNA_ORIENTATION=+